MEFRNLTRENFDWDTEDEVYGLLEPDHGIHPELATEFPGVLLEEEIPGPVAAVEAEILYPNAIDAAAAANSGIVNTTGVYDGDDSPSPFLQ